MDKQLELLIRFWEAKLQQRFLLDSTTTVLIELTIKYLEEIKEVENVPGMDKEAV